MGMSVTFSTLAVRRYSSNSAVLLLPDVGADDRRRPGPAAARGRRVPGAERPWRATVAQRSSGLGGSRIRWKAMRMPRKLTLERAASCEPRAANHEPPNAEPRIPNQWSNCPVLSPGQVLDDRYEILALLAEGGMGAVYRARRTLLGDEVAIKIVRGEHGGRVRATGSSARAEPARGCAIPISFRFSTSTWTMRIIPFW